MSPWGLGSLGLGLKPSVFTVFLLEGVYGSPANPRDLKTGAFEVPKFIRSLKGLKETFSAAPTIRESFHVAGQEASSPWFGGHLTQRGRSGLRSAAVGELLIREKSKDFRCTNA
ncbi:hypothetical protein CDAR_501321 [Caerostris darwini]|uniref:Uncharacterized protein n=1 Tax=Caerostris darwini TaxID=1538125 RepID=A0AAV4R4B5_9ARAC|nr:hypothetical protein CDAR_501321 [Caerostris darwini]